MINRISCQNSELTDMNISNHLELRGECLQSWFWIGSRVAKHKLRCMKVERKCVKREHHDCHFRR